MLGVACPARSCLWYQAGHPRKVEEEECSVRVLVVEDDEEMAEAVAVGLRQAHMAVDTALDGPGIERQQALQDFGPTAIPPAMAGSRSTETAWCSHRSSGTQSRHAGH